MTLKISSDSYKRTNRVFFFLVFVSLAMIMSGLTPTVQAVKQLVYCALVPSLRFSSDSIKGTGNLIVNITNIIKVNQENIKLKNQLLELSNKLRDYQSFIDDNVRLRQLLDLSSKKLSEPVFAGVIIREPSQWYQWVIINKGLKDGMQNDLPVISILEDGRACAFGRIIEVYDSTSKVALLTNSLSSIPVQIKDVKVDCILDGYNSQYLKLDYIPQSAELHVNDEIITSPLSNAFDGGISVGKIIEISKTNSGDYENVIVIPYSQTQRVYEVVVLLPK